MANKDDSLLDVLVGGVIVASVSLGAAMYHSKKSLKRRRIPLKYPEGLDAEIFKKLCKESEREIKRLKIVEVNEFEIKCNVKSSSGLSIWEFSGDFYDYGNLTGKYWIFSDNKDSTVPKVFMNSLLLKIREAVNGNCLLTPISSWQVKGLLPTDVEKIFLEAGFKNILKKSVKKPIYSVFSKKGYAYKISINEIEKFEKDSIFDFESIVCIYSYE